MHSKASELLWPLFASINNFKSSFDSILAASHTTNPSLDELPDTRYLGILEANSETAQLKKWITTHQTTELRISNLIHQCTHIQGDTKNLTISNIGLNVALFAQKCALAMNWKLSPSEICAAPWPNGSCAWLHSLLLCDSAVWLCAGQPAGLEFLQLIFQDFLAGNADPKWSPFWSHNSEALKQGLPGTEVSV